VQQIRAHWQEQMGGAVGFDLPAVAWSSIGSFGLPARWRYASAPEEQQRGGGWYDVEIELEADQSPLAIVYVSPPPKVVVRGAVPIPFLGVGVFSPTAPIRTRAAVPAVTGLGVAILPAAAPIKTRPVAPLIVTGTGVVQGPITAPIVTRAPAPVVSVTGGGISISAQVRMRFPMPTLGAIAGGVQLPPVGQIRLRGVAPVFTTDVPVVGIPAARLVVRGRVPTVSNTTPPGTVLFPAPRSVGRGVVPIVVNGTTNVAIPAAPVVTRGRVPTVSNVAPPGTVLSVAGLIRLTGRVPTFSAAGTPEFPTSGRVVSRGRVPTVTGG
jgi:hypothetical protein